MRSRKTADPLIRTKELAQGGFWTADEVAEYLGCSRSQVHNLKDAGLLPHFRESRLIRFPRLGVIEYAASRIIAAT